MIIFIDQKLLMAIKAYILFWGFFFSMVVCGGDCEYFQCVEQGDLASVKKHILNGTDIENTNHKGATGLHISAAMNKRTVALYFLNAGAKKNATTEDLWTPLHFATATGSSEVFELLIDYGVNIYALTSGGDSTLHLAAASGHVREIARLLLLGLEINLKNNDGYTPLHWVAHEGKVTAFKFLVNCGADFSMLTNKGESILDVAKENNQTEMVNYIEQNFKQL